VEDFTAKIVNSVRAERSLAARQRDIYDSHRHRAFSIAYYMTGNELEAERILAQTFIRAFEAAPEPAAQDVDAALLKELRQRMSLDLDIPSYTAILTASSPLQRQRGQNIKRTDLEEEIAKLPAMERFLFLMRDVEGYTPTAIAELLRLPESYVQRGVFTARVRLRQAIFARRIAKGASAVA